MAKTKKRRNLFVFLKDFFGSVIKEAKKVIWPTKKNLFKYSMVTILFMVFICLFFVGTDLIIALISYVKELIG
ncbi:MAG TPA: preprotein translocase subunit SecE [Candidatus Aphodocola excrementigallinarum]|uniref:Protein translocase subunit SecE n=1 Tax=Candidatus Aphodocola excrementigallinarum TaxID=2840670 RepID=A0A9D1IQZ2_9FIRM|nr:preprotein translocase subunit SecE [Candidatus Aphodocola excrementigallinarum]